MAETIANVISGDAKVFIGTVSSAAPADSVAYGTDWGGTWTHVGLTIGGASMSIGAEYRDTVVDTHDAPVKGRLVSQSHSITLNLAEATLENIQKVVGTGTLTTGGTEKTLGFGSADELTEYAIGLEGEAIGSTASTKKYRRAIIWKAVPDGAIEHSMNDEEDTILSVTFRAYADLTQTAGERILKIIDEL